MIASKYRDAEQTCLCANRILVQDGVYDAFTKRLAETAGAMKVADGFEPGAVIGPLIDMKAVEKVEAHIADAVKKGAKVVTGGKRAAALDRTDQAFALSVRQMRGTAPAQIPGAKISVCHGVGGMFAASGTIIMSNEPP